MAIKVSPPKRTDPGDSAKIKSAMRIKKSIPPGDQRRKIDSTYLANYGGQDPEELRLIGRPAKPGVPNTRAVDALMRNVPPAIRGKSIYKNPSQGTTNYKKK